MALVKRGNVELRVAENLVEEYLSKGYSLLDDNGNVVRKKIPVTIEDYKAQLAALEAENLEVKKVNCAQAEEIQTLTIELESMKNSLDSTVDNKSGQKPKV